MAIVAQLPHRGLYQGKIRFIESQGVNWHMKPVPGAPSRGTPRESQAKLRDGTVSGLYKDPVGTGPAGQHSGKICFIEKENLGYKTKGGRHVANRSSDTRVAYPEVKIQVRDLVRAVGTVVLFDPRGVGTR